MCRNHRGFVEALVGANRIGADVLLLNTSFAGPAMAEVIEREGADIVIYDQEFTATVDRALRDAPDATRILAWVDDSDDGTPTLESLIDAHLGRAPERRRRKSDIILLTSGTTGTPKGAKRSAGSGGAGDLKAVLDRTPWRAEETDRPRRPDVPRLGFLATALRRAAGLPHRHPPQVRPRGDARA